MTSGLSVHNILWWYADFVQDLSGPLAGEFADWPSHVQDRIHNAVIDLNNRSGRKYELYSAVCDYDLDHGYYVRGVARAKVVAQ